MVFAFISIISNGQH